MHNFSEQLQPAAKNNCLISGLRSIHCTSTDSLCRFVLQSFLFRNHSNGNLDAMPESSIYAVLALYD